VALTAILFKRVEVHNAAVTTNMAADKPISTPPQIKQADILYSLATVSSPFKLMWP